MRFRPRLDLLPDRLSPSSLDVPLPEPSPPPPQTEPAMPAKPPPLPSEEPIAIPKPPPDVPPPAAALTQHKNQHQVVVFDLG